MRPTLLVCVFLLLAGCTGPAEPTDAVDAADPVDEPAPAPLPRDISKEIAYLGAFDAVGEAVDDSCEFQPWCFDYPFVVGEGGAVARARLSWSIPANDLDLLLLRDGPEGQEGEEVASAKTRGPGSEDALEATLEPGSYRFRVVPYLVLDEPDARLHATFHAVGSS